MSQKHLAVIAMCALSLYVGFSFMAELRASAQPDILSQHIRATAIRGETIARALDLLTSEYSIPVGIELADPKRNPDRKIDLDLPETTVKEFLDSVVSKDPRYTWKLEGDVIHVWPLADRDHLLKTLLDTKISHFAVADGSNRYRIHNDIMDLPEIKTKLIIADVTPMIFLNFSSMARLQKGVVFEESDLTLRELLDRLAQKTNVNRWIIRRWGDNNEFISLSS
jgi:hypothetical protein